MPPEEPPLLPEEPPLLPEEPPLLPEEPPLLPEEPPLLPEEPPPGAGMPPEDGGIGMPAPPGGVMAWVLHPAVTIAATTASNAGFRAPLATARNRYLGLPFTEEKFKVEV